MVSLLIDAEERRPHSESRDTAILVGTVYVSFAGPQNSAGGPFDTLNHSTKSWSIGSNKAFGLGLETVLEG